MNIHSKSYPMQTTPATPGQVRPPTTLFERFRADPRGASSYPEWLDGRPARVEYIGDAMKWEPGPFESDRGTARGCLDRAQESFAQPENVRGFLGVRVVLDDGVVIKEWLPETKDSAIVEKT
jgi:hypothetical protein